MTAWNRTLNVLTFLLAVVTLVFGLLLYERRQELDTRADMLADTVADVTRTLDLDSNTHYADHIHVDPVQDPNQPDQLLQGGTLGADHFHRQLKNDRSVASFQSILDDAMRQARDVQAQRNALGDALSSVAMTLELQLDAKRLHTTADRQYADAAADVTRGVADVAGRERAIAVAVSEAALAMGKPVDAGDLKSFDAVDATMKGFVERARSMHQRSDDYASVLEKAPGLMNAHDFQANLAVLEDRPGYASQLNHLLGDFAVINERLGELKHKKIELDEMNGELNEYVAALDDSKDAIRTLNMRLANVQAHYDILYKRLRDCETQPKIGIPGMDVRAQVVKVDSDYNYIIIDLGARDNLAPNSLLNIGRDRELICKVSVTRVMDDYAVCEVLPEFRLSSIKKGDRVVLR